MKEYREGVINAIKILDDEVQRIRAVRDNTDSENLKMVFNDQILSHILSIQHLREVVGDVKEEE